ncbi:transmembrane domain-containing protein [Cryptosporidium canis]|uniref:Transmembrane domain-containing protein n=1 Tax=Cryptosporidium canis TaxID=195482 RepID=A0ABQ8PAU4_9CRYT|nr:transmembrane domain-containing protein [Cryptosporidium canis]KAJ1614856.1 transmembrane domain-containing protein [Cryptosporidium canis]
MDDLNFNIETVNLDSELDFETFDSKRDPDPPRLGNIAYLGKLDEVELTTAIGGEMGSFTRDSQKGKGQEGEDFVSRLLGRLNPINWEVLKGHFDVSTEEIKQRLVDITTNTFSKESILQNINIFMTNMKNPAISGMSSFPPKAQNGFELFYCKNLDQSRRSDLYGPFWLNVTLAMLIGTYSTILPHIRSKYVLSPDITRLTLSFSYIFTSLAITCSIIYGILLYSREGLPITLIFTIYGYSSLMYFPGILFIILFNHNILNWLFLAISAIFSMMFLYNSLFINGDRSHSYSNVVSCIAIPNLLHVILLKTLFF